MTSANAATVTSLVERFEGSWVQAPTNWSRVIVGGTTEWTPSNGGNSGQPAAAHGGTYNALLFYNQRNANTNQLITPALNLAGQTNVQVNFWHAQVDWSGDQDYMRVYYRTSSVAGWVQLAEYTANVAAWTERTLDLPFPSTNYYLAFEGIAKWGYGVCVDDVLVWGTPMTPVISVVGTNGALIATNEAASMDKGTDFGALSLGSARTNVLAITNSGLQAVSIYSWTTNGAGAPAFRVAGLPASVAAGTRSNFMVVFQPPTNTGYAASLTLSNNSSVTLYSFNLAGTGVVALMKVLGTNNAVIDSDTAVSSANGTRFRSVSPGVALTNRFAITNGGTAVLTILSHQTNGADAGKFQVRGIPPKVSAGAVSNFTVVYQANAIGLYTAFLIISNDTPNQVYKINYEGSCFGLSTNTGPLAGGNIVTITNGVLGNGTDITNLVFGGVATTNIIAQGANWVTVRVPPGSSAGLRDVIVQSASVGPNTLFGAYIYNAAGAIFSLFGSSTWASLGDKLVPGQINAVGMQSTVYGLAMGWNGILYAAGAFTNAGGSNCFRVAQYDGTRWTSMGAGVVQFANANCLMPWLNSVVYCGGYFTNIGGTNCKAIARWNGTNWTAMGQGLYFSQNVNGYLNAIAVQTNGHVIAGGYFTNAGPGNAVGLHFIAKWNGSAWTNMAQGFNNTVAAIQLTTNDTIYVGGAFTNHHPLSQSRHMNYISRWDGRNWTNMARGFGSRVSCLAMSANGVLFAGGWFTNTVAMDGTKIGVQYIAKWDGQAWTNISPGRVDFNNWVISLRFDKDGALYAGGTFTNANGYGPDGVGANRIAKWDGAKWSALGRGMSDTVQTLATDTNDSSVYVGGLFKLADGSNCWYVAKWSSGAGTGVDPAMGPVAGGFTVTISGTNLCTGSDVTNVTICGNAVTSINNATPTQIVVTAGAATVAGLGDVIVYSTSIGQTIKANGFTYNGPAIQVFGTNSAQLASGEAVSADKGSDFGTVRWGGAMTNTFSITNSGNQTLTISGVTSNGSGATAFRMANRPSSILPGATASFQIIFAPPALQTYTARFDIAHNAPNSPFVLNVAGDANKRLQTITFPAIGQQSATNVTRLAATASSGLPVSFAVVSGPGSIAGGTNLSYTTSGQVLVRASQTGDTDYAAAADVTNAIVVVKASQLGIAFTPDTPLNYNATNTLSATGGSGTGTFSFAISSGAGEIVGGNKLHALAGTGEVMVLAIKAADDFFAEASAKGRVALARIAQAALVFNPTSPMGYGETNLLTTTGGSGAGAVSYTVLGGPGAIVGGDKLTATGGVGQITVLATKAADTCYSSISATGLVLLGKASQAITFPAISDLYCTNLLVLTATADSGLPVSFAVESGPAALSGGSNVTFSGLGEVVVVASQGGNATFDPATPVTNRFNVLGPDTVWRDGYGAAITNNQDAAVTNGNDFGTIYAYSAATNVFAITNAGSATWLPQSVVTNGAAAFALVEFPTALVAGAVAEFKVVFAPVTAGPHTAAVVVTDNTIGSPFTFNLLGNAADPRMEVLGTNGAAVASHAAVDFDAGTDFGTYRLGGGAVLRQLRGSAMHRLLVTNAGNAELTLAWVTNGAGAGQFSVEPPASVPPQRSAELLVTFAASAVGVHTAEVAFVNNSTNTPYIVNVAGTVIDPRIALVGADGNTYADDTAPDTAIGTDFGLVNTGVAVAVTLAITNRGQTELVIAGSGLTGQGADAFIVSNLPATVTSGTASNFTLHYLPLTLGAYSVTLALTNNSATSPFRINAGAVGIKAGEIGLDRSRVSYSATYGGPAPAVDVYILTNKGSVAFNYTNIVAYDAGAADWLALSLDAGEIAGEAIQPTTGTVFNSGLGAGVYVATNTITSTNAVNSPVDLLFELAVAPAAQTITFGAISNQLTTNVVGLAATASSALPVEFSVWSGPATLADGTNLAFTGAGTVRILASQTGDTDYAAAPLVTNAFTVSKADQAALSFSPTTPQTYGSNQTLTASGGSGSGALSYDLLGGPGNVVGDVLSLLAGTGSVTVQVTRAEDDYYTAQTATAVVECARAAQTISFPNPGPQVTVSNTPLVASASSSLIVGFAILSGPATLSGPNLVYSEDGTVVVRADQIGDDNWSPAPSVTQSIVVAKSPQDPAVFFDPLTPQAAGTTNGLATFGGAGTGTVSFAVLSGGGAIVDGDKLAVNTGTGTVVVTATQAADDKYTACTVTANVTCAKAAQSITFPPVQDQVASNVATLAATASSGLGVTFAVASGPATLSASSNLLFTGTGVVAAVAHQAGDDYFGAAPSVTNLFLVSLAAQNPISFAPASPQVYGTTNALSFTGGSGSGTVAYAVNWGAGEIVGGSNLSILAGTGSVEVVVTKAAEDRFDSVNATAVVVCAANTQTITFAQIPAQELTNRLGLAATASSGLTVAFALADGPGQLDDGTNLSFTAAGTITLLANQAGNENFTAAPEVTNIFTVTKLNQESMIFTTATPQVYATLQELSAEGGSGNGSLTYGVVSGGGSIFNDTWLQINAGTGTVVVTATKAADDTYAAQVVTSTVACAKADQAIEFALLGAQKVTNVLGLAANAQSGLTVSFATNRGPVLLADNTNLAFSAVGMAGIQLAQAGDDNWNAAADITNTFHVYALSMYAGPFAGGNSVVITNGLFGAITNLLVGGTAVTPSAFGDNWATVTIPALGEAGFKDIVIQTSDLGDANLTNAYWVNFPGGIVAVTPTLGLSSGGYAVAISGTNLSDGVDVTNVTLCGVLASNITVYGATQVVVFAGNAGYGRSNGPVRVCSTSFGESLATNAFTYDGPPASVVLFDFSMREENGQINVCWQTASETDTLGFDVYRMAAGTWTKVNDAMIPSAGWPNGGMGASYCVADPGAAPDGTHLYKLVEYETTGKIKEYGPFERSIWTPRLNNLVATPSGLVIQWLSRATEVYDVMRAPTLRGPYVPAALGLTATPPVNAWTDRTDAATGFYRIEAR